MANEILLKIWKHFDFNLNNLLERIRVQKTIFLLKKSGYPGLDKYSYSWYLYGPYSRKLAADAFEIGTALAVSPSSVSFSEKEKAAIEKVKSILAIFDKSTEKTAKEIKFELLADILFWNGANKKTKDEIFNELVKNHDYLNNRTHFDVAWGILSNHNLL